VTILTPTRGRDWPVVRRCLYSVRGQTYQNFEHLVCSDGVFEPYIQRPMTIAPDRRQRYYHSPTERGHSGAGVFDYMMQFAEGELVCFLHDRSVLLPDYVAHMTAALEDNPSAGFAVSRTLHLGPVPASLGTAPLVMNGIPPHPGNVDTVQVMVRTSLMREVGWVLAGDMSDGYTYQRLAEHAEYVEVPELLSVRY
jgi:glycosyltransferase involved in cell wall biosynthesis